MDYLFRENFHPKIFRAHIKKHAEKYHTELDKFMGYDF